MPRCADVSCGRWRPERLAPKWASGIRFNGHWYCSRACVEGAARAGLDTPVTPGAPVAALPPLRLGVLLRHLGALSLDELNEALARQQVTGRRLGAELERSGVVPADLVLKALAAQSGVSYFSTFDVARVTAGPVWLPAATVHALGLVPFEADETERQLRVVCAAPVPRGAMRALLKLTGWIAEPYLVTDEVWQLALRAYRRAAAGTGGHQSGGAQTGSAQTVTGLAAAASQVADAALADRAITMRHANYDQYTWVRVEGPDHVSDLLVMGEEEECLAERIAR